MLDTSLCFVSVDDCIEAYRNRNTYIQPETPEEAILCYISDLTGLSVDRLQELIDDSEN